MKKVYEDIICDICGLLFTPHTYRQKRHVHVDKSLGYTECEREYQRRRHRDQDSKIVIKRGYCDNCKEFARLRGDKNEDSKFLCTNCILRENKNRVRDDNRSAFDKNKNKGKKNRKCLKCGKVGVEWMCGKCGEENRNIREYAGNAFTGKGEVNRDDLDLIIKGFK